MGGQKNEITFIDMSGLVDQSCYPIPAEKFIPEWYKNMDSYNGPLGNQKAPDGKGQTTATIKRCMPVFDAMTSGYLILSHTDVYVSQVDGLPYFEWAGTKQGDVIMFHLSGQAIDHPLAKKKDPRLGHPKWNNPWLIQTPKGYSSLVLNPLHRDLPFTILSGVVDTDKYQQIPINFPFALNDPNFTGLIPAGTPIAQVIPFKRSSWVSKKRSKNQEDEKKHILDLSKLQSRFFDAYKGFWWSRKEYK